MACPQVKPSVKPGFGCAGLTWSCCALCCGGSVWTSRRASAQHHRVARTWESLPALAATEQGCLEHGICRLVARLAEFSFVLAAFAAANRPCAMMQTMCSFGMPQRERAGLGRQRSCCSDCVRRCRRYLRRWSIGADEDLPCASLFVCGWIQPHETQSVGHALVFGLFGVQGFGSSKPNSTGCRVICRGKPQRCTGVKHTDSNSISGDCCGNGQQQS